MPVLAHKSTVLLNTQMKFYSDFIWGASSVRLNRYYTFDTFIEGTSNSAARIAALQVSAYPGKLHNPLFIQSRTGLGKSHLAHAIANKIVADYPDMTILITNLEHLLMMFIRARDSRKMPEFKNYLETVDLLLFDGVDKVMDGFCHFPDEFLDAIQTRSETYKQTVLVGCRVNDKTPLDDALMPPTSFGKLVNIERPNFITRFDILKRKMKKYDKPFSNEIIGLIALRTNACVRDLEGALSGMIARSQLEGGAMTLDYAKKALISRY